MTWRYEQATGDLYHNDEFVGTGYSGAGRTALEGRNNPHMQDVQARGPVPCGKWTIGKPRKSAKVGPVAMDLIPVKGTATFRRSAIMIHGDNKASNASHGCVILARPIRERIAASGDTELVVEAGV
jgi:hypothetical protein